MWHSFPLNASKPVYMIIFLSTKWHWQHIICSDWWEYYSYWRSSTFPYIFQLQYSAQTDFVCLPLFLSGFDKTVRLVCHTASKYHISSPNSHKVGLTRWNKVYKGQWSYRKMNGVTWCVHKFQDLHLSKHFSSSGKSFFFFLKERLRFFFFKLWISL